MVRNASGRRSVKDFLDLEPGAGGSDEQVDFVIKPVGCDWSLAIFLTHEIPVRPR
ncbi:hypothetical protein [Natranaeroarchaeum aerophilus]|uniref:Uncharacterized protein n=1 Tax=Natranaeroarchaeum aerophilus TaxID=2917711 RepID=A0AAE3FTG2_9EURY|nr:hypothetical protein [Natranaeroarchaeum aerophilus]MCL9815003.1 hypothetical protein [Natranaeroarchaeum aerophilus]